MKTWISLDIKVTDFCTFECEFCYQGSNRKGKHADFETLKDDLLRIIRKTGIFEVVIGGGEPTLYPHIEDLIKFLLSKRVNVGITTRNYKGALKLLRKFYLSSYFSSSFPVDKKTKNKIVIHPAKLYVGFSYSPELKNILKKEAIEDDYFTDLIGSLIKIHLIEKIDFGSYSDLLRIQKELTDSLYEGYKTRKYQMWISILKNNPRYANLPEKEIKKVIKNDPENIYLVSKNTFNAQRRLDFLLLGYKDSLNSPNFSPQKEINYEELANALEANKFTLKHKALISLDTLLANKLMPYLKNDYFHTHIPEEGVYTFYYDAVKRVFSESSYSKNILVPVKDDIETALEELSAKLKERIKTS